MNRALIYPIYLLLIVLSSGSCKEKSPTPKPLGAERIDIPQHTYVANESKHFSFNHSDLSKIECDSIKSPNWINIAYPSFDAKIYCTYIPITPAKLKGVIDESDRLAYSHALKSSNINQSIYTDSINNIFAVLYTIDGNVATPCQFYLTDNNSHFFRGSLYYNSVVNADSVKDMTNTMREDIRVFISSFRWK